MARIGNATATIAMRAGRDLEEVGVAPGPASSVACLPALAQAVPSMPRAA